jgi:hypothetical protein
MSDRYGRHSPILENSFGKRMTGELPRLGDLRHEAPTGELL